MPFYYSELWTFVGKREMGHSRLRKGEYTAKKKKRTQKNLLCRAISSYINQCWVWELAYLWYSIFFDFFCLFFLVWFDVSDPSSRFSMVSNPRPSFRTGTGQLVWWYGHALGANQMVGNLKTLSYSSWSGLNGRWYLVRFDLIRADGLHSPFECESLAFRIPSGSVVLF